MPEPGFVNIISPDNGAIAEVPQSSLFQHYAAGWRLLKDDDVPPVVEPGAPKPLSEAEVAAALAPKPSKSSSKE